MNVVLDVRLRAPLLMLGASLLFATMGVCVKLASALYPAGEIVFYRGLVGVLLAYAVTRAQRGSLRTMARILHQRAQQRLAVGGCVQQPHLPFAHEAAGHAGVQKAQ